MCGIAGFLGTGDAADLLRMTSAMAHRGPDASGQEIIADAGIFLGHRRLSVVDLSAPPQPMWDAHRLACISYNGEVYNQLELRKELEADGFSFLTNTDTEVVLNAYLRWGEVFLDRLNGMFALAIYDSRSRNLFLARDRFGKKPLFYAEHAKGFIFASELTSLLNHPCCPRNIAPDAVGRYFAFNSVPAPHTILRGVSKLLPGHLLTVDSEKFGTRLRRWFRFEIKPDNGMTPQYALEAFSSLYERAVKVRLMSDVPLGVFLSGGLDSTSVVLALVSQGIKPTCYSIGFEDPSFDESAYAAEVARHFGLPHRKKIFSGREVEDSIERALLSIDEPMGDASIVPTFLLCEFARREVTVALGGDGGDELLAGYDPFVAMPPSKMAAPLLSSVLARRGLVSLASMLPTSHENMSPEFKLRRWLRAFAHPPSCWMAAWMSSLDGAQFASVLPGSTPLRRYFEEESAKSYSKKGSLRLEEESIYYYLNTYLPDSILCKVDRASMRVSLEVRAPFLDKDLSGLIAALPYHLRFRFPKGKILLRRYLRGRVPENVLKRPKKGFGMPVAKWLLGPLRGKMEASMRADILEPLGIDPAAVRRIWQDHLELREDHRAFLWDLLVLADWKKRVLG